MILLIRAGILLSNVPINSRGVKNNKESQWMHETKQRKMNPTCMNSNKSIKLSTHILKPLCLFRKWQLIFATCANDNRGCSGHKLHSKGWKEKLPSKTWYVGSKGLSGSFWPCCGQALQHRLHVKHVSSPLTSVGGLILSPYTTGNSHWLQYDENYP